MSQIVHVQTRIETTFGVLDDEGNAIPQQPVVVTVAKFAADAFVEAHAVIARARDEAAAPMQPEPSAASNGNRAQRRAAVRKPKVKPAAD